MSAVFSLVLSSLLLVISVNSHQVKDRNVMIGNDFFSLWCVSQPTITNGYKVHHTLSLHFTRLLACTIVRSWKGALKKALSYMLRSKGMSDIPFVSQTSATQFGTRAFQNSLKAFSSSISNYCSILGRKSGLKYCKINFIAI